MSNIIKLIYSQLETDKINSELLLENLINSELTQNKHLQCIDVIKQIVLIKESIKTLDNYLDKTEK